MMTMDMTINTPRKSVFCTREGIYIATGVLSEKECTEHLKS